MQFNITLGDIQVKSIDTSSGIFVAKTNIANGWKSQIKSNSGFGEVGDGSRVENCIFVVSDDDAIDSPMEDHSVHIEKNTISTNGNTAIHFEEIDVELLNQNAAISIGDSLQTGWSSQSKGNEGYGEFFGDTIFSNNQVIIKDDDIIDAPVSDHHVINNH